MSVKTFALKTWTRLKAHRPPSATHTRMGMDGATQLMVYALSWHAWGWPGPVAYVVTSILGGHLVSWWARRLEAGRWRKDHGRDAAQAYEASVEAALALTDEESVS